MTRLTDAEIREAALRHEFAERWLSQVELRAFTRNAREIAHRDGSLSIELPDKSRFIVARAAVHCDNNSFYNGWSWERYCRNAFYGAVLTRRSIIILDSLYAED